jgi:Lar family restriction alleviation protein
MEKDDGSQEGLPCPFCGYRKVSLEKRWGYSRGMKNADADWAVVCRRCGASGPAEITTDDAIVSWSTRVSIVSGNDLL